MAYAGHLLWYRDAEILSDVAIIHCPEAAGFSYGTSVLEYEGHVHFYGYAYPGEIVSFHVTFRNISPTTSYELSLEPSDTSLPYDFDPSEKISVSPPTIALEPKSIGIVTFSLDATDVPASPQVGGWYGTPSDYQYGYFHVNINGAYADELRFHINVLPSLQPKPDVWIFEGGTSAPDVYSAWDVMNRRIGISEWYGQDEWSFILDTGFTSVQNEGFYLTYYYTSGVYPGWSDSFTAKVWRPYVYDLVRGGLVSYEIDNGEFEILLDGSLHVTERQHYSIANTIIDWNREWWFSGDTWRVKIKDTFTNVGTEVARFALGWETNLGYGWWIGDAYEGAQWIIPGVWDDWTYLGDVDWEEWEWWTPNDLPYIPKDNLGEDRPVLYGRDFLGEVYGGWSSVAPQPPPPPGAYGAIIFPELPEAQGLEGWGPNIPNGAAYCITDLDRLQYWWAFTLNPGGSYVFGPWFVVYTGSNPNAERQLLNTVSSLVAPIPTYFEWIPEGTTTVDSRPITIDAAVTVTSTEPGAITIAEYPTNPGGPPPTGFMALDKYFDISTDIPEGAITWPIEIRIYYTDAEVSAAGIDRSTLRIFYWDGGSWVQEPDSGVDTTNNYVWARVYHLTPFAPMGGPLAPPPTKLVITVYPFSVTAGSWTTTYTVQRQDQYGNPVTSGSTTVNLDSTSTGTAKKFAETSGGSAVTSITIPDGSNAKDFYYYDEKAGSWTISVSAAGLTGDSKPLTVNPTQSSVQSATGTGSVVFSPDAGVIEGLTAVSESTLPSAGKPSLTFPHGFFTFRITGLGVGQTVTVTVTLPSDLPTTASYWKYHASEGGWIQIPMGSNDGDNVITITLVDGGLGDDDLTENGIIVDQGGPATPLAPVGGIVSPVSRLEVLAPYLALVGLLGAVAATAALRKKNSNPSAGLLFHSS